MRKIVCLYSHMFKFPFIEFEYCLYKAYYVYLRFLSTRYMRPLMRVMGKLIHATT